MRNKRRRHFGTFMREWFCNLKRDSFGFYFRKFIRISVVVRDSCHRFSIFSIKSTLFNIFCLQISDWIRKQLNNFPNNRGQLIWSNWNWVTIDIDRMNENRTQAPFREFPWIPIKMNAWNWPPKNRIIRLWKSWANREATNGRSLALFCSNQSFSIFSTANLRE